MKIKRIGSELLWNYLRNPWNVNGSLDEIVATGRMAHQGKQRLLKKLLGRRSKDIQRRR